MFPICVIPNGVEVDFFSPGLKKKGIGKIHFIYVGRFQPEKNLFFIIEQLSAFKQRTSLPFHLHMVGEGPQLKALKETTRAGGLSGNVTWHGWVGKSSLKKLYQESDCLLMPSLYEGMSNAILEAMACGLSVIASRVGGNIDLVENGKTGYLFRPDDPKEFQSVLNAVLKNREQSFRMGLQARRKISSEHNWKTVAQKYASIFNEPPEIHTNP
jgi:glycosyltransferase involved in cell wall biosynthesis